MTESIIKYPTFENNVHYLELCCLIPYYHSKNCKKLPGTEGFMWFHIRRSHMTFIPLSSSALMAAGSMVDWYCPRALYWCQLLTDIWWICGLFCAASSYSSLPWLSLGYRPESLPGPPCSHIASWSSSNICCGATCSYQWQAWWQALWLSAWNQGRLGV